MFPAFLTIASQLPAGVSSDAAPALSTCGPTSAEQTKQAPSRTDYRGFS
jgi:hypothetical protein